MSQEKWYQDGLRFSCVECGQCCTGEPGYVWLTAEEMGRIAEFLELPDKTLPSKMVRRVGFRYSLTERSNGDCVFLVNHDGKRQCSIYEVRPLQCRTWPFWTSNLKSPVDWAFAGEVCPGMNNGKKHDVTHIETMRTKKEW